MPGLLVVALTWLLTSVLGNFVLKLITAMGIGLVAYTGASALLGQVQTYINTQLGSTTAEISNVLNYCGFYTGLNIIIGAISARIGTGTAYRLIIKAASST